MMKRRIILLFAAMALAGSCSSGIGLQVRTESGKIEGIQMENDVKAFLGIPYAEAPVGDLRWKEPQPKKPWKGVLETKAFGNDPMQPLIYRDMVFRGPQKSEDCLYLNVWTGAASSKDKLPVLIYFNGGGLTTGSGSEPRYDGAAIAGQGVIGVTANYREGIFGFFAHPELSAETAHRNSGNYGFLDQVAAIRWVKENIEAFGGDPDRITIAGESAGSFSVSVLMASPLSRNLISGAILSSGAEVMPYNGQDQADAEETGRALLMSKGLGSIADARALSADELQNLFPRMGMASVVIDGYFMPIDPNQIFDLGVEAAVPVLAGWNSQEATPSLRGMEPTLANYKKSMTGTFGRRTDAIFEAYGILTDADVNSQKARNLASDLFTGFCTWKLCDYHAAAGYPVYRYKFNRPRPGSGAAGAVHSADIEYAMGNLSTNKEYSWENADYMISNDFLAYYANFCKTGNPNGDGLVDWPAINTDIEAAPVLQIDSDIIVKGSAELEKAYRTLEEFYLNPASR